MRIAPLFPRDRVFADIMNMTKPLAALGLLLLSIAAAMLWTRPRGTPGSRSVQPVQLAGMHATPVFSRDAATGLFVGVRSFPHDSTLTVPYAVDDAIDLAHRFSLDARVGLIPPARVVLALSGAPQKEESKRRLRELKDACARIVNDATSGDIHHLLKEQSARAGDNGLLVLSIATHGFQKDGDAYILGSTSDFGAPETSLRIATILDVAAQAKRSLIFIDACRDRIGQTSRGGEPDPAAAAPHIERMARVQGQAIFYAAAAGGYAFDDPIRGNGVFTAAVLDGLNCQASSPRGTVLVETLHTYVDREVRRWIRDNDKPPANPATQVSMEGETRNMPLSQCWRTPSMRIRASVDGSIVNAYSEDTRPLWRKDLGAPIVHTEVADLDADAFPEVAVGLRDRIVIFDRDGKELWTRRGDAMTLATFTTGDLFEKRTNQIVALWNGEHTSRLTVLDSEGNELSHFNDDGRLQHVAIGRPTNMHAPKIAVATSMRVLLLHARKAKREWQRSLDSTGDAIRGLRVEDGNLDSRRDIAITTRGGMTWFTFDGKIVRRGAKVAWQTATVR